MVVTLSKSPVPEATLLVPAPVPDPAPGTLLISSLQWNNLIDILDGASADKIIEGALGALSISKITNLQTELDGKAPVTHTHVQSEIINLVTDLAGKAPTVHTHVATDVTDLDTAIAANAAVTANTNKETNATHTGDVTGDVALSITPGIIDDADINASAAISITKIGITGVPNGTQFLRDDGSWQTVPGGSSDHGALTGLLDDDHTQYQLRSEKDTINGYAGLDGSTKIAGAQQTYGALANTACEGNDSRLSDARTPLAHTHVKADITDFAHTHPQSEITDLIADLAGKAAVSHTHVAADVTDFDASVAANAAVALNTAKNDYPPADAAKLAGIEPLATADQTDGEIKTAYENNADTNAFTDAEQTKLTGIESGATADQSDVEIETAYNNQVPVVSTVDAEAGVSTTVNRWTPQRVAEAIAALAPGFTQSLGELATVATGTAQTGITGTPVVLNQWDTSVHNVNATASLATEDIEVDNAGTYRIDAAISFSGSNNTTYTLQVYQNAVAITTVVGQRRITSGTDVGSMSLGGSIIAAATDTFDIRVSTDGTGDITVERANFSLIRIA